jgi:hypothetical protein
MYNISLRVLNTFFFKMLKCLLVLKCTHLIYLYNYHSINTFNYTWFENLWKHTWIKLLKLTLSSYNKPQSKYASHVSNVINPSPFKAFKPHINWLLWLRMYPIWSFHGWIYKMRGQIYSKLSIRQVSTKFSHCNFIAF